MMVHLVKRITDRLAVWQLVTLTLLSFVATYFAMAQAITVAWLASFPNAAQVDQLKVKFWLFAITTCVMAIVDLLLLVVWMVRIHRVRAARRRELID
jgi:hypothetical protein